MFSLRWFIVRHFLCWLKGRKTGKSPMEAFFFSFLLLSHEHDLNWGKRGLFELTWRSVANVIDCLESDLLFSCCFFFVSSCFSKSYHLLWFGTSDTAHLCSSACRTGQRFVFSNLWNQTSQQHRRATRSSEPGIMHRSVARSTEEWLHTI